MPLICGALVAAIAGTPAADSSVAAGWRTTTLVADGSIGDWPGLQRAEDGPGVAFQNDAEALYIAVATNDETVRQQLASGLVVWLDGRGRKAQTFGLRLEGLARRQLPGATPDADTAQLLDRNLALNTLQDFDLLGPSKGQRRLIDDPARHGLNLALGVEAGTIAYELKVPLERSAEITHAVGAKPGSTISIGLETPADPKGPRQRRRLDDPTNTYPTVYDPYGGFFRNPPPPPVPGASSQPKEVVIKPMKLLWISVRLATPPADRMSN